MDPKMDCLAQPLRHAVECLETERLSRRGRDALGLLIDVLEELYLRNGREDD